MSSTSFTQTCVDCALRLANGAEPICDGSGVIAITDWPTSRVVICPCWPCDQDEPLAYWQAIDGLGYDLMPATMQQRIRDNVIADMEADWRNRPFAPYMDEPADDPERFPMIVSAGVLISFMALCIGVLAFAISR